MTLEVEVRQAEVLEVGQLATAPGHHGVTLAVRSELSPHISGGSGQSVGRCHLCSSRVTRPWSRPATLHDVRRGVHLALEHAGRDEAVDRLRGLDRECCRGPGGWARRDREARSAVECAAQFGQSRMLDEP
jgi:hypothetical protein